MSDCIVVIVGTAENDEDAEAVRVEKRVTVEDEVRVPPPKS